jgi:hypothetical protein
VVGNFLAALVVAAAATVIWAAALWLHYPARPSGWRYTFGGAHRRDRQTLNEARQRRRTVRKAHRQKLAVAEKKIKTEGKAGQKRVQELTAARGALLDIGRGAPENELGGIHLYQHTLLIAADDPEEETEPQGQEEWPLAHVRATANFSSKHGFIKVTRPDGTIRPVKYPLQLYTDTAINKLEVDIINGAVADREFRAQRRREADEMDKQIARAEADKVAAEKAARGERDALILSWPNNPERIQADHDWHTACDDWEALTGRRPRWWGRR